MFEIGDKVKCINAEWGASMLDCPLELGAIYTVKDVAKANPFGLGIDGREVGDGAVILVLAEVENPWAEYYTFQDGFDPRRFRKLPNISESLEAVKELFNKRPSEAEARELMKDFMKGVE